MSLLRVRLCAVFALAILAVWGCSDSTPVNQMPDLEGEEETAPQALLDLAPPPAVVSSASATCGVPTLVDLRAGSVKTGEVEVAHDESNIFVTFRSDGGRRILATAVFVGSSQLDIPVTRWGTPRLLSFPYTSGHRDGPTEVVWEIPRSDLGGADGVIAAFAQVGFWGSWGEGEPITPGRNWAQYFPYSLSDCGGGLIGTEGGTVSTPEGEATLTIPAGALASPVEITIDPATVQDVLDHAASLPWPSGPLASGDAPSAAPSLAPIALPNGVIPVEETVWDFGPDGLNFDKPVTVTIRYAQEKLPIGFDENLLRVFVINGIYDQPPSTVDVVENTVTAEINHFSFGFIGYFPPPSADLSVSALAESADAIELGQAVTYTATLSNAGPNGITDGVVYYQGFGDIIAGPLEPGCTEELPFLATVQIACEVGAVPNGGAVEAPSASFVPQSTGATFEVWVDPGSATADDPDLTNNRATESYSVTDPVADLQIQNVIDTPDPAAVGEDVTYNVQVVAAPGTAQPVEGATLLLNPLGDAVFVSATDEACFGTVLGATCPLPTLNPGLIYEVAVTMTPNSGVSVLTLNSTVNAPSGIVDPDLANNSVLETTNIGTTGSADLRIVSATESADPVELGQTVTYAATIQNYGPDAAPAAVVYYQAFGNVTAGTLHPSCTETAAPPVADVQIVCSVGDLALNDVSLVAPATFVPQGLDDVTVWIDPGSSATDPNTANNRVTHTFTVIQPSADLQIQTLSDSPDPVPTGGAVTYSAQVVAAPGTAQTVSGATLTLNPAGDAAFQSASDPACFGTVLGATCPLPDLAPGLIHGVDVTFVPNAGVSNFTVTAEASVPFGTTDPDLSNNSATETTTVTPPGPTPVTIGQIYEGTIPDGGGSATYQFDGTPGQLVRLHLSLADENGDWPQMTLNDPGAGEIFPDGSLKGRATDLSSSNEVLVLPEAGSYTVSVETGGASSFRFGVGTGEGRLDTTFGPNSNGVVQEPAFSSPRNPFLDMELVADEMITIGEEELGRFSPDGSRKASFGSSGAVDLATAFGASVKGKAMAVQPDGKIVVAAQTFVFPYPWIVARFEAGGTLDTSFGTGGWTEVAFGTRSSSTPVGVGFQTNGADLDIIVTGDAGYRPTRVGMARLNPDGSLDAGFGTGGMYAAEDGILAERMAMQSDGSILVGGTRELRRYTPFGTRDAGFGSDGLVVPIASGTFRGLEVLPNDDILLLGEQSFDAMVIRMTPNGVLNASFGSGGLALFDFGYGELAIGVVEDSTGDLFVVGNQDTSGGDPEWMIIRMNRFGALVPSFGVGGHLVEYWTDQARAVALDSQGRIVVGGQRNRTSYGIEFTRHLKN